MARIMLHGIVSRGSDRFRGFFDRSTYTFAAQIFTDILNKFMAPTASRTHSNVAELESNPSLTKTSEGFSAEFSFPGNGAVENQAFATAPAKAASLPVPS